MTTLIINRQYPAQQYGAHMVTCTFHTHPTVEEINTVLLESLSGPLDEYNCETPDHHPPGVHLIRITAKNTYQERYRGLLERQARRDEEQARRDEERTEAEHARAEAEHARAEAERARVEAERTRIEAEHAHQNDQQARLDQAQEYNDSILLQHEVYSRLSRGMVFFSVMILLRLQLYTSPQAGALLSAATACETFTQISSLNQLYVALISYIQLADLITVPRVFTIWWLVWNNYDPLHFPLPECLQPFPNLCLEDEDYELSDLLVDDTGNQESPAGHAVFQAWQSIPSMERDLMLVLWAARQESRRVRNFFCHPKPEPSAAADVLSLLLSGRLSRLQDRALSLATSIFTSEDDQ
jgi:hypothetical protein